MIAMTVSPFWLCTTSPQFYHPLFGHGVGPVAMEHAKIEVLLGREMPHTSHKRPPQ